MAAMQSIFDQLNFLENVRIIPPSGNLMQNNWNIPEKCSLKYSFSVSKQLEELKWFFRSENSRWKLFVFQFHKSLCEKTYDLDS